MTEFISGSAGTGKGEYVLERIRERLGNGRRKYLIVPEQQAVLWESRVCRALPPSSSLELEVVSFRRLADTVFRAVGGLTRVYTGEAGKILLMWRAVVSVKDSLSVYTTGDGHEEKYVSLLLETLSDLRRRSVTPAMLSEAGDALEGSDLAGKLRDLSLIFSAYRTYEEENESEDPECVLDMLANVLRTERFLDGADVFVDSFYSLTPVENEILFYIFRDASDVFVTFTFDETYRGAHFDHVKKFFSSAQTSAKRAGREVKRIDLKAKGRRPADISYIEKNLWDFAAPPAKERDGSVKVIRCADRYEEARAIGAEIERAVHSGASYSDIAVVARDVEAYRGILDVRLDALGIPYHLSRRIGVATSPVTTLVTSLLDAVSDGAKRESVVRVLKTGLVPLTPRECSNFEEYAATWNIRGKKAYVSDADFTMNPAGCRKELSEWGATVLEDANSVRRALKAPFEKLFALFCEGEAKIRDVCVAINDILLSFDVWGSVCRDADEWRKMGKDEDATRLEASYASVVDALSAMATTVPEGLVTPGAASRLFFAVASSFDTASIPSRIDVVTLGSASGVRLGNVRHVILAGCVEGEFPAKIKDGGFFTAAERERLEELGLPLTEGREIEESEELFRFWRCAASPSETLTVTYFVKGDEGKVEPSVGANQIMKLLDIEPADYSLLPAADSVWSEASAKDAALFTRDAALRAAISSLSTEYPSLYAAKALSSPLSADGESLAPGVISELFPKRLNLTQARIDKFSGCPFSYYTRYVLSLGEPASGSIGAVDVGNLIHYVLEMFFKETFGRDYPIPDAEAEEIVDRITADYVSDVLRGTDAGGKRRYLFRRLKRSALVLVKALMEEFSETSFKPYRFELKLGGENDSPTPLVFTASDGSRVSLWGTIDRVDRYEKDGKTYVRVVDYKTFGKSFNLADVQKGVNLQLLIYLFTLWKGADCSFRREMAPGGEVVPAGMVYLSASPDGAASDGAPTPEDAAILAAEGIERSGLYLDDETSLAAMGSSLGGKYIPKKGTSLVTLEEMGRLYGDIEKVVIEISDAIRGGRCDSTPVIHGGKNPCEYCKMKPVCRHNEERSGRDE